MIILVINCGSSSIKYQLLDMKNDDVYDVIAKGIAEKIGLPAGILQYAPTGRDKIVKDIPIPDHKVGMELHFSLSCIGEGNDNPLQCSCLENPREGEAWWAAVYGVAQSWTRLK